MSRLIDADALLEQMKHRKDYVGRQSDPVCIVEDAPTVGGWVSVKDRLPEDNTLVLALVQYEVGWYRIFAWRDKKGWASSQEEFSEQDGDFVTHWMPVPDPPEEEK